MARLNVSIDAQLREELFKLVPPRRRSQVVKEALRNELLKRKRQHATEVIKHSESEVRPSVEKISWRQCGRSELDRINDYRP